MTFWFYWRAFAKAAPDPEQEWRFCRSRLWRFDFAWPDKKIAVEIDGNAWHVRGGGRHSSPSDLEKMSAAAALGWRVFRLSPSMLEKEPERWIRLIEKAWLGVVTDEDLGRS